MTINLIPYEFAHMDIFEQAPEDIERYGKFTSETPNPMAEYGTCFTAIYDGRILVVGGVLHTSLHTGKCWTMLSIHAKKHGLRLVRAAKIQLENMMRDMGLHRLETANLIDAVEHHKWCKLLGFRDEGEMRYYDDQKRTYIRFAKYMEG